MAHKTFIPSRFFYPCRIIKKDSVWENSELVEKLVAEEFKGAVFNLGRHDVTFLTEQGINITLDIKKIYCYRDIELKSTVEFDGKSYIVKTGREYMKHDELRIYYIERLKNE